MKVLRRQLVVIPNDDCHGIRASMFGMGKKVSKAKVIVNVQCRREGAMIERKLEILFSRSVSFSLSERVICVRQSGRLPSRLTLASTNLSYRPIIVTAE